jgi:hypothetical protein
MATEKPDGACDRWNGGYIADEWICGVIGVSWNHQPIWDWLPLKAPSLANAPMEPEKPVGEGG